MRLSDAIALGRHTIPEMRGDDLTACGIGMSLNAVGDPISYWSLYQRWPWLHSASVNCKQCQKLTYRAEIVWHSFDWHVMHDQTMTLDQLIDFIRSIEPPDPEESSEVKIKVEAVKAKTVAQGV